MIGVSFSADGKIIASASADKTVRLWRRSGQLFQPVEKPFQGHSDAVIGVSFRPDGRIIASASADNTVKLWSLDGRLLHTLRGHTDWVRSVSFSSDGTAIASASLDGTIILWNLNLNDLLVRGCNRLHDYLKTNSSTSISESDRYLCDGIGN
jgi:WD40 repeat protein